MDSEDEYARDFPLRKKYCVTDFHINQPKALVIKNFITWVSVPALTSSEWLGELKEELEGACEGVVDLLDFILGISVADVTGNLNVKAVLFSAIEYS
jgi:hypothetical protein